MKINQMKINNIDEYAQLFMSVFNSAPWNDKWTYETAKVKILNLMNTDTFLGLELIDNEKLTGIIFGQKEQYYSGVHFQIQEFCVRSDLQGKGYGSKLLEELVKRLKEESIEHIYLITSKGERTEDFYQSKGFKTSENMILMSN